MGEMALIEHLLAHLHGVLGDDAVVLIHVLLEIEIAKLEHERKLLLRVDNIKEAACGKEGEQDEITNEMIAPLYLTMFGCLSSFRRLISLMAVQGTPSSSESSRILLRATIWPVSLFFALYTIP